MVDSPVEDWTIKLGITLDVIAITPERMRPHLHHISSLA